MFQAPGATLMTERDAATAPMVVLYERDDAIAVPLLSQLRLAGYDVRAARTPVELFSMLGKTLVALVLVDLGNATAGRREFWVALDAQRRGRALQVMTFRYSSPVSALDLDIDPAARALADVEVHGAHEFQRIVDGVRQRIPLDGGAGAMQPIGSALGVPSPYSSPAAANPFAVPAHPAPRASPDPYGVAQQPYLQTQPALRYAMPPSQPPYGPPSMANPPTVPAGPSWESSRFAHPASANPFVVEQERSPFAQPYAVNPFAEDAGAAPALGGPPSNAAYGSYDNYSTPSAAQFTRSDPAFGGYEPDGGYSTDPNAQRSGWSAPQDAYGTSRPPAMPAYGAAAQSGTPVADAWTPPDASPDEMTSAMPEVARQAVHAFASGYGAGARGNFMGDESDEQFRRQPSYEHIATRPTERPAALAARDLHGPTAPVQVPTAPVPVASAVPAMRSATDQALGNVLVEGALLTQQKLEVLKGIQQMLMGVEMHFKLGELALLFRFLSPDQLLAALLVSRGLVSPQQIASLGRAKQDLASSGMDHDLETLLVMFHILPAEQLQRLRAELA